MAVVIPRVVGTAVRLRWAVLRLVVSARRLPVRLPAVATAFLPVECLLPAASAARLAIRLRVEWGRRGDVNTTLTMILSIVTLACCCTPLGIVALINVMNANNAKKTGDLATAQAKNKTALMMSIIGIVGGLIIWTAVIILQLANSHAF